MSKSTIEVFDSYHKNISQDFFHDIWSRFDDNGKGESELDGKKRSHYGIEPVPRKVSEYVAYRFTKKNAFPIKKFSAADFFFFETCLESDFQRGDTRTQQKGGWFLPPLKQLCPGEWAYSWASSWLTPVGSPAGEEQKNYL